MAQMVYDLIDPGVLINYVRAFDNEVLRPEQNNPLLDEYLPDQTTEDLEFRIRKGALNDVDVAEYRAWDTPAPMTGRPGVSFIRGSLGPVSRQIPLGEEEYLRSQSLLRNTNDPIIRAIYDDSERMIRSVRLRILLAKGDLFDDGIVTIAENGLVLTANFGRSPAMRLTAPTVWSNTGAATPLSDLMGAMQAYV